MKHTHTPHKVPFNSVTELNLMLLTIVTKVGFNKRKTTMHGIE